MACPDARFQHAARQISGRSRLHAAAQRRRDACDVRPALLDARRIADREPFHGLARRRSDAARPGLRTGRGAALDEEAPACFCRLKRILATEITENTED